METEDEDDRWHMSGPFTVPSHIAAQPTIRVCSADYMEKEFGFTAFDLSDGGVAAIRDTAVLRAINRSAVGVGRRLAHVYDYDELLELQRLHDGVQVEDQPVPSGSRRRTGRVPTGTTAWQAPRSPNERAALADRARSRADSDLLRVADDLERQAMADHDEADRLTARMHELEAALQAARVARRRSLNAADEHRRRAAQIRESVTGREAADRIRPDQWEIDRELDETTQRLTRGDS